MAIDISKLNKGQPQMPPRILMIGQEGVGKSTFANNSESPVFICAENGLVGPEFANTPNITPKNWVEVLETIKALTIQEHNYKTLVVDTLDWIEPLLHEFMCARDGKTDIIAYGYGKGFDLAAMEWRPFLAAIERLRAAKKMAVVFLAHAQIKSFSNPVGNNFDRYEAKISKQTAALTREWVDATLFACFEIFTHKDGQNSKAKGIGSGERVVYTNHSPAWDAKNRYGMPDKLALDFDEVMAAIVGGKPDSNENIIAEILSTAADFSDEDKKKLSEYLEKNKADSIKLRKTLNQCRAKAAA